MNKIEAQFNLIAAEYDAGRRKFIPCFDEFYERTTDFIAATRKPPRRIMDLGAGTGLLSKYYFQHFPQAEYLLVDLADEMLQVARKRFLGLPQVKFERLDYSLSLPEEDFELAISALSIHHLSDEQKSALFQRLYRRLPAGGALVNYDQFRFASPAVDESVNAYWYGQLEQSGLSATELARWRERRQLDRECTLNDELAMLRAAGFQTSECVYSCRKFSVILAVK